MEQTIEFFKLWVTIASYINRQCAVNTAWVRRLLILLVFIKFGLAFDEIIQTTMVEDTTLHRPPLLTSSSILERI